MAIEVLTGLLVIITGFYAWVTYKMLTALQQQAEAVTRPYLTINVFSEPKDVLFYLRIANTGRTGASNVRLTLDRDFYQFGSVIVPPETVSPFCVDSNAALPGPIAPQGLPIGCSASPSGPGGFRPGIGLLAVTALVGTEPAPVDGEGANRTRLNQASIVPVSQASFSCSIGSIGSTAR